MKKTFLMIILCLLYFTAFSNEILFKTLPNGMEVAVKENTNNTSVGFYCFVKTGSVNEGKYLGAGISHYLEHIVSSGTTKFRTEAEYEQIGKEMGSLVNAYTTYDATAFHIIIDKQYQDEALKILSEQMQFCVCDSMEVAREKEVILKEIVMRSTPPRSKVYQRHRELVFPNSNKRYPIIGYTELFKTISRDELQDYYEQRYAPNNMVFVAVGDFDPSEMMIKIEETFQDFPRKQIEPVYLPIQNTRNGNPEFVEEFEIQQPIVFISTILPNSEYEDESALDAAMDILFSKRKSPIRLKLVEELKLVNYIYGYTDISANSPEGLINITFEAKDPDQIQEIIKIIDDELNKYAEEDIFQKDIDNIINRKRAQKLLSTPGVERECNRIGWDIMRYGIPDSYGLIIEQYENLTPEKIQTAISKHLIPKNRVVFYAMPKGTKSTLERSDEIVVEKTEPEKFEINKNLSLIFRKNTEKPIIRGVISLPISEEYETLENAGTLEFMTELMFKGSDKYHPLDLSEWKEDHAVTFWTSVGSFMRITFKCLKDDYPEFKEMLFDAFQNPSFPDSEISLLKDEIIEHHKRSQSRAGYLHRDFRSQQLYPGQKDGLPEEKKIEIIQNLSQEDLIDLHKEYFKTEKTLITLFGDLEFEEAEEYAKEIFKKIPKGKIKGEKTFLKVPDISETFINSYDFEQVNIDLNFIAPKINSPDFWTLMVIESILRGGRGRLHKATRGVNDLAYFTNASYDFDPHYGFFRLTSQTSIDKKDELVEVLQNEIKKLKQEDVTVDEINLAIEEQQKIMETYLTDNQLPNYMSFYEMMGLGYDFIDKSSEKMKEVTPADIKRAANKYFKNTALIISEPNENVDLMVE